VIAPEATLEDHTLDVYAVLADPSSPTRGPMSPWRQAWVLARVASRLKRGHHVDDDAVIHLRTRSVSIEAFPRQHVDIDGELEGRTPLNISVIPSGLRVLAPPATPVPGETTATAR
jgi:diacylglycerol kinase (ATP)